MVALNFEMEEAVGRRGPARARDTADMPFGVIFSDHMVTIAWNEERGWHDARVRPYETLQLAPSAQVFHYGQAVFEGMRAFRWPDERLWLFRPDENARRMRSSCERMAMPALPDGVFVRALEALVSVDADWVPKGDGRSLYLRPFMIATQESIGFFRRSNEFLFLVIASPAGTYFPGGIRPLTVWVEQQHTRAFPGGTGRAKCAGNYAAGLLALEQATARGCDQVIWLDAGTRSHVEEMGTSNIFFLFGDRLVTPPLGDTILSGVNRASIFELAMEFGISVDERPVLLEEIINGVETGHLTEMFSCGTSSTIMPIGRICGKDTDCMIGAEIGPITSRLRTALLDIQYGRRCDPFGWLHEVHR